MGLSVSQSVCLSVCRRFNSLLDGLFVPQTIPPTQRVTRINLIEGFFLKRLRCRDKHLPLLYGLLWLAILCAENNAHGLAHAVMGGAEAHMHIAWPFLPPWIRKLWRTLYCEFNFLRLSLQKLCTGRAEGLHFSAFHSTIVCLNIVVIHAHVHTHAHPPNKQENSAR